MNHTISTVIGHRVTTSSGEFVYITANGEMVVTPNDPPPCTRPQAYQRIAAFLTEFPNAEVPTIVDVTTPVVQPLESASDELGGLLEGLLARHGLNLGLSRAQINTQIAKELASLGAIPAQIARLTR